MIASQRLGYVYAVSKLVLINKKRTETSERILSTPRRWWSGGQRGAAMIAYSSFSNIIV